MKKLQHVNTGTALGSTTYSFVCRADRYGGYTLYFGWNAVEKEYEVTLFDQDDDIALVTAGTFAEVLGVAKHFTDISMKEAEKLLHDGQPPEELIPDQATPGEVYKRKIRDGYVQGRYGLVTAWTMYYHEETPTEEKLFRFYRAEIEPYLLIR